MAFPCHLAFEQGISVTKGTTAENVCHVDLVKRCVARQKKRKKAVHGSVYRKVSGNLDDHIANSNLEMRECYCLEMRDWTKISVSVAMVKDLVNSSLA